jgi:hypothetical protein
MPGLTKANAQHDEHWHAEVKNVCCGPNVTQA